MEKYLDKEKTSHIAVFEKEILKKVMNGEKKIESRFSKNKIAPYDSIQEGDVIFFKETSGPIIGKAIAKKIKFFSNLDKSKIQILKSQYQSVLCTTDNFWNKKIDSSYATLISLQEIKEIEPIIIEKKDRRPWVILKQEK